MTLNQNKFSNSNFFVEENRFMLDFYEQFNKEWIVAYSSRTSFGKKIKKLGQFSLLISFVDISALFIFLFFHVELFYKGIGKKYDMLWLNLLKIIQDLRCETYGGVVN